MGGAEGEGRFTRCVGITRRRAKMRTVAVSTRMCARIVFCVVRGITRRRARTCTRGCRQHAYVCEHHLVCAARAARLRVEVEQQEGEQRVALALLDEEGHVLVELP